MSERKKALQAEVVAVKSRWGTEVKLSKAPSDSPTYPLPIGVLRTIPQPDHASAFDVAELAVQLWIDSLEPGGSSLRVDVPTALPAGLKEGISERVLGHWVSLLPASGGAWRLEQLLSWADEQYSELLSVRPEFIEQYDGVDTIGMTIRRYAVVEPRPADEEEDDSGEEEAQSDTDSESAEAEEDVELSAEEERLRRIKLSAEVEAERRWREERRKEAEALGDAAKEPMGVSKKQQQALLKEKQEKRQGHRLRKTGSRANKFDAEAAGKKANKKNGLMH